MLGKGARAVVADAALAFLERSADARERRPALATRGVPNAPIEAVVLFALVDGISQQYVMGPRGYPIDAVIAAAAARYAAFTPREGNPGSNP